ncbi:unnamed protein product [Prunus armeniaca]|uniref:Uncharacterized protein n=1 Tax=Prunus armeniaca TaxID=36596 RepID=A0A6J5UCW7_PRUAR|nr:unnamed protein product [Prunus armeniaca]
MGDRQRVRERPQPSPFAAVSSSSRQLNFATIIIPDKNRREISKIAIYFFSSSTRPHIWLSISAAAEPFRLGAFK